MATSTFMKRNVKIKYHTDPKTGAVTVLVNNKPTQTFTDKTQARAWTAQNKGMAKEAETQLKDVLKVSRTGGKSTAEIMAEAAKTGKRFTEVKKGLAKEGKATYLAHKSGTMKDLAAKEISTAKEISAANPTTTTTTTTTAAPKSTAPSTTQTSSVVSRTQKPTVNNATNRIANAVRSSSNAINKRAGVGKYRSKLRFK